MIDFQQMFDSLMYALHAHPLFAAGLFVFLGILLIWKPKAILKVIAILVAVGVLLYIISLIFEALNIGFSEKEKLFQKTP